ncbi:MAG: type II toxin-antitoxin system VapC family toxin [Gammaproteobacteria bacterium]|nr:type II toxin-antitoxin system VapC family toxin [Gammaproteobacteria bacterium]
MLNLDTHVLIFAVKDDLRPAERNLLSSNRWSVSAIVLWELAKLVQLRRIDIDLYDRDVKHVLAQLHVWPIDLEIARASTNLDFRGDPADEIIAATSIIHDIPLLTRDHTILRSHIVPLATTER